jgi:hypothetical protein
MNRASGRRGLRATLILVAAGAATLAVAGGPALAAAPGSSQAAACVTKAGTPTRVGHIAGIVGAVPASGACRVANSHVLGSIKKAGDPAQGTPPLIFHGGPVMGTSQTGTLVITPIFWNPTGHPMASAYKSLISQYLGDVATASGSTSNVYSILPEYSGSNGSIHYAVQLGTPISDTNSLPSSGCKVARSDKTGIYADGTGYNACLDDAQVQAQANRVITANNLPVNLAHIYVMYLPKQVESCFNAGSTTTSSNACTINHQPSAAFCAYHSQVSNGTVYANMPFPIYLSTTGFTCGSNVNFGVIESPNGNPDGDTVISPSSHEINESITDPDTATGWFDSSGFENGDECNFVYGATQGASGQFFNQVINGHDYLTQEEFSNSSFAASGGGCLQHP